MLSNFAPLTTSATMNFAVASPNVSKIDSALKSILVADPTPEVREHYVQLLNQCIGSPCILFTQNGRETAATFEQHLPEMVILDVRIADIDVFETAKNIWHTNPSTLIVFLAESVKQWHLRQISKIAPKQAVYGYICKAQDLEQIAYGVKCVFVHKNIYVDPIAKSLTQSKMQAKNLTDAEYETLVYMALGLTDRVMAARQNISVRGLQNRIGMIFQKLLDQDPLRTQDTDGGVINLRVRVVVEAIRTGLLDVEHFASYESELLNFMENRLANS